MVEFALVLPILLVILAGIVKFGQAFNYYIDETHLASEGSRFASVDRNPGGSGTPLGQWLLNQADATDLQTNGQVTITCLDTNGDGVTNAVGDAVRVTVKYPSFNFLPFLGTNHSLGWFSWSKIASLDVSASSTVRLEAKPSNYSGTGC
jgi:Flp pilus assembly protein TadG